MRMATYDLDPDVTRCGLHLLDVCTLTDNGCCNAITQYDRDMSQIEYVNKGYYENAYVENDEAVARALQEDYCKNAYVENDEAVARALQEDYCENAYVENDEAVARALQDQEEFTRIDSLEASGVSNVGVASKLESPEEKLRTLQGIDSYGSASFSDLCFFPENMPASVLAQDWFGPSKRHYSTGNDSDKKDASSPGRNMEADDCSKMENDMLAEIGNFYSCFSPGEKSSYVEDFTNALEITDEFALDGEVGKRLNQMIPVPVPKGLGKHVVSSKKAQANWYRKLPEAWREAKPPPVTPEEAARLIIETLNTDQKADVEGLLTFYGLPLPHTLVELTAGVPTSLPAGVKYEFETLPVDAKAVADGDGMTVYVSTTDPRESSRVPSDVQMAAVQRSEARAENNYAEADALHKRIIDSGYRVLQNFQNNEEILARKCRIRLRGIDAPENAMPYGEEAKKELTNIVQGKCLRVLAYGEDRYGRCVSDVYCNGKFVQQLMLKKGLAWHYTAYDQRPELAKWEKEAEAKRVGLWASPNPEKPWEWRKDKRQVR